MTFERENIKPKFVALFTQTFAFTDDEFALLLSAFESRRIPKKEYYVKAGDYTRAKA
jgi:hypothetical protein